MGGSNQGRFTLDSDETDPMRQSIEEEQKIAVDTEG